MAKKPTFDSPKAKKQGKQPLTGVLASEVIFSRDKEEFSRGILFLDRARFQYSKKVVQEVAEFLIPLTFPNQDVTFVTVKTDLISPIIDPYYDNSVRNLVSNNELLLQTLLDALVLMRRGGKLNHSSLTDVKSNFDLFLEGKKLNDMEMAQKGIMELVGIDFAVDETYTTLFYPLTGGTKQ